MEVPSLGRPTWSQLEIVGKAWERRKTGMQLVPPKKLMRVCAPIGAQNQYLSAPMRCFLETFFPSNINNNKISEPIPAPKMLL